MLLPEHCGRGRRGGRFEPLRPRHPRGLHGPHGQQAGGARVLGAQRVRGPQRAPQARAVWRQQREHPPPQRLLGVVAELPGVPEPRRIRIRRDRQGHRRCEDRAAPARRRRRAAGRGRRLRQGRGRAQQEHVHRGQGRRRRADGQPVRQPPLRRPGREGARGRRELQHHDGGDHGVVRGRPQGQVRARDRAEPLGRAGRRSRRDRGFPARQAHGAQRPGRGDRGHPRGAEVVAILSQLMR